MNKTSPYVGYRYPGAIIAQAVWLYHRFTLSYRDVEELLAARGVIVSHEPIRQWCRKFGLKYAKKLRHRQAKPGDKWHLDEVRIAINGEDHWLWHVVDQDHHTLDILIQKRRDKGAAKRFFKKLLKRVML